ncbi:MAG: DUF5050 domain-containing protein [Candidatus Poribacteria bacterium]|nr:DUF5050 domain-containing protein [Candidatus Poribacteria bacterium]
MKLKWLVLLFAIGWIGLGTQGNMSYGQIYWTHQPYNAPDEIWRADLDGTNVKHIITAESTSGYIVELDIGGGKIYWISWGNNGNSSKIWRADLDGTNAETLITTGQHIVNDIELDVGGGKIYWLTLPLHMPYKIWRADLDGTNAEHLITFESSGPNDIKLDVVWGKMYMIGDNYIHRADLDGENFERVFRIDSGIRKLENIELDMVGSKIYWTSHFLHGYKIWRADLDGTNAEHLITATSSSSRDIIELDVSGGRMYWRDDPLGPSAFIWRADLDGTNAEHLITTGVEYSKCFALDVSSAPTSPIVRISGQSHWVSSAFDVTVAFSKDVTGFSKNDITVDNGTVSNFTGSGATYTARITPTSGFEGKLTINVLSGVAQDTDGNSNYASALSYVKEVALGVPQIYYIVGHGHRIQRINLDGTTQNLGTQKIRKLNGIALDMKNGKMYLTEEGRTHWHRYDTPPKIWRADLDGRNVEDLVTNGLEFPNDIKLDIENGKMYWIDIDKILRADLDGSNVETLIIMPWQTSRSVARGYIALDVAGNKMYWTNIGTTDKGTDDIPPKILRANLNGSNVEDLIMTGLERPTNIELDVEGGKIYWIEELWRDSKILRADIDGTNAETLVTVGYLKEIALDVGNGKVYWMRGPESGGAVVDSSVKIGRANLDGSNIQEPLTTIPNVFVRGIALGIPLQTEVLIPASQHPVVYWVEANAGRLNRLVGNKVENFLPSVQNVISLTVDAVDNKIYWTEQTAKNKGSIKRANLDGSNVQGLVTLNSIPNSISVDTTRGKLYWTNSRGHIQQSNRSGKQIRNLVQNLDSPDHIVVDTVDAKLYWTEASGRIRRANLNGKSIQNIASNLGTINGIAISDNKIYYGTTRIGASSGSIGRANFNGSSALPIINLRSILSGIAIDSASNKLYWTESDGHMWRANLNGKNIQQVVSDLPSPTRLVLRISRATTASAPMNNSPTPIPEATHLLANYPNPFNPETWIPYQLAEPSDVKIIIYDTRGVVVRRLVLGHQPAGTYTSRTRAAYWDGRNAFGERVASGIYFYQLQTDNISSLRKMLILK